MLVLVNKTAMRCNRMACSMGQMECNKCEMEMGGADVSCDEDDKIKPGG